MGKATDAAGELLKLMDNSPPVEPRKASYPELRLRADVAQVAAAAAATGLQRLEAQPDIGCVVVNDEQGGRRAVLVPVEEYIDLIATRLVYGSQHLANTPLGFESAPVEQVDPGASWLAHRGIPGIE
jgi:hypothetical protein